MIVNHVEENIEHEMETAVVFRVEEVRVSRLGV